MTGIPNGDGDFGRRPDMQPGRGRSLDQAGAMPIEGQELRRHLSRAGVAFAKDTVGAVIQQAGFELISESTISRNGATNEVTITPTGPSFSYYSDSVKYTETAALSITGPTTEGLTYFYLDAGTLNHTNELTGDILATKSVVAATYWDSSGGFVSLFIDMRRTEVNAVRPVQLGLRMRYFAELDIVHSSINGSGASEADAELTIDGPAETAIVYEGSRPFAEAMNISEIPVFYRTSAGWRNQSATTQHVVASGSGRIGWNQFNGTIWTVTEVGDGKYALMHYLFVPDPSTPVICVMGINEYDGTVGEEDAAFEIDALHLNGLSSLCPVWFMFGSVLWQTDDTYTNAAKARLISAGAWGNYRDWRNYDSIGASLINASRAAEAAQETADTAESAAATADAKAVTAQATADANTTSLANKEDQHDVLTNLAGHTIAKFDMFYMSSATTWVSIATSSVGRSLLSAANAAALRAITLAQAAHATLDAIVLLTVQTFGLSLLETADSRAAQVKLQLNDETGHTHFTDFICADVDANGYQQTTSGSGAGSRQFWQFTTTSSNSQGVLELGTGTTSSGYISLHVGNNAVVTSTAAFKLGARSQFHTLSTASDEYIYRFGMSDDVTSSGVGSDEIGFRYDRATDGVNWQCITRSGGTETKTDSGIAVTASTTGANMQVVEFTVNEAASSVEFFIDGVSVATHTTNITSSRLGYGAEMEATAYTSVEPVIGIDWTRFECTRASAR